MAPKPKTQEQFIKEIYELVGEEFIVLGTYVNAKTKIKFKHTICNTEFEMRPYSFLGGYRCKFCSDKAQRRSQEQFIKIVYELVGDEYEVIGKYLGHHTKIEMIHHECGNKFYPHPSHFLNGTRCPFCFRKYRIHRKTTEEFKKEMFNLVGDEYELIGEYKKSKIKVQILHKKCGEKYSVNPEYFLQGNRCPNCKQSKGEKQISVLLDKKKIKYIPQYKIKECKNIRPLPFDFAIFDNNNKLLGLIEYDGVGHFKPFKFTKDKDKMLKLLKDTKRRDKIKNDYCKDNDIHLLRIPYWEFNNIEQVLNEFINKLNS